MIENTSECPIHVFLLFKNRLLRDALNRVLRKQADLLVVGCASQEDCCPQTVVDSKCHVLLVDFFDPQWLPANLRLKVSGLKCLMICMDDNAKQFLSAVRGGATGYLLMEASISDVVFAVRAIFRGEPFCSPKLGAALFQMLPETPDSNEVSTCRPLTLRQQWLAALVANGLSNKEIAIHLKLSHFTVKNHVYRLMKQFGAKSRSQVVLSIRSQGYRSESTASEAEEYSDDQKRDAVGN